MTYNIELFLRPLYLDAISESSKTQYEYDTLYAKYKEFARLSQELFDLSNK